jgi:hypothetical protein
MAPENFLQKIKKGEQAPLELELGNGTHLHPYTTKQKEKKRKKTWAPYVES